MKHYEPICHEVFLLKGYLIKVMPYSHETFIRAYSKCDFCSGSYIPFVRCPGRCFGLARQDKQNVIFICLRKLNNED